VTLIVKIRCFVVSVMRTVTKRLRLESRGFRCKVALYLIYLHIKFDDDMKVKRTSSLGNS